MAGGGATYTNLALTTVYTSFGGFTAVHHLGTHDALVLVANEKGKLRARPRLRSLSFSRMARYGVLDLDSWVRGKSGIRASEIFHLFITFYLK